jgi:hypothetical protein
MRLFALLAISLALAGGCWSPPSAWAGNTVGPAPSTKPATPGVELANMVSVITGVAISPLMGVSAVGVWKYFHAQTPEQRARLPWFAQPWFWMPAFVLVTACFLKDTLGLAAPRLLKKPLDVADALEHKISGLVATGAFVPLVAATFTSSEPESALPGSTGFLAAIDLSWLGNGILVPVSMIAFFIVFLASNAINVLILLSPFAVVDAALKGFRLLILLTVAATAFANPWLGAAWALIVIAIAYCIAGWSFRLSHFGMVFVWDSVTLRRHRFVPKSPGNRVYLARQFSKVPARTYGTLLRDEQGSLVLKYRPWLVLPKRILVLPQGSYAVARGLFYSQIVRVDAQGLAAVVLLPPRYRGHEEELVSIYGLADVRDAGLRAVSRWLKELFTRLPAAGVCAASGPRPRPTP